MYLPGSSELKNLLCSFLLDVRYYPPKNIYDRYLTTDITAWKLTYLP